MYKVVKVLVVAGLLVFQSCDKKEEWMSTESGLQYSYVVKGEEVKVDSGSYLIVHMSYSTDTDSVMFNSQDQGTTIPIPYRGNGNVQGSIEEGFGLCGKGDSVIIKVNSFKLFSETFRAPLPAFIDSASNITFNIGVEDVLDAEGFKQWQSEMSKKMQAKKLSEDAEQLIDDMKIIGEFLQTNNIDAQKTQSGISYVVSKEGVGENAKAGQKVSVNYSGYVLNGAYFDSSVEEVAKANDIYSEGRQYAPFEFTLGQGAVIKGWDEGIALLNKGAKATFYIPSTLAYGNRQRSEVILANSILVFDVELVDIN